MEAFVLAYRDLRVSYGDACVLHGVSAQVFPGRVLGVVGESGSGKTTLVRAAMGLLGSVGHVVSGGIEYRDAAGNVLDLAHAPERQLRALRGVQLGMVFQDSLASLAPIRRVRDQFLEAARPKGASREGVLQRAGACLGRLGVEDPERVLASYPFELSGGLAQRVGIALALMPRPRVLLADEPTSALDAVSQKLAVMELARAAREEGAAIVLVTHNIGVAHALADSLVVLKDGAAVEQGAAAQVLAAPQHPYTRELLDAVPVLEGRAR